MTADGYKVTLTPSQLTWSYRKLCLPEAIGRDVIILAARIRLKVGDRSRIYPQARRLIENRMKRQPSRMPSAGCFFKNPSPDLPAARLIDASGFKGMMVGGAQVSPLHANFIVNIGGATAADVLMLSEKIQKTVEQMHGIRLEPEVKIVGQTASA